LRSVPTQGEAGKRARRFLAASSVSVIRVVQRPVRRIGAPDMCRPHASVLAAASSAYEARAVSRHAERRRTPNPLVLRTGTAPRRRGCVAATFEPRDTRQVLNPLRRCPDPTAAMSTLSAQRPTPAPNSRLTGDRPTPNRRRQRQARTGEADFPRGEREQDAIPTARHL